MTVTFTNQTGTFDGIAPSPCDPVAKPSAESCAPFTAEILEAQYKSGVICPKDQEIELFEDDFSPVAVGQDLANPPWTPHFDSANVIWTRDNHGVIPVAKGVSFGGVNARRSHIKQWNQGYANFANNSCGVWIECILQETNVDSFVTSLSAGLAIGIKDVKTTSKIIWWFRASGGGIPAHRGLVGVGLDPSEPTLATAIIGNSAALEVVTGDKAKLKLFRTGPFGWIVEAWKNDILVGSSTSSLIQLSHDSSKNLGFFVTTQSGTTDTSGHYKISHVRGGVT